MLEEVKMKMITKIKAKQTDKNKISTAKRTHLSVSGLNVSESEAVLLLESNRQILGIITEIWQLSYQLQTQC